MKRRTLLGVAGASMASLAGCLGATEYTVTDVRVGQSSAPVGLDVSITEPNAVIEHPASLEFTVTNQQNSPVRVRNTGIWPFGLLELVPSLDVEEAGGTILWTSRYEESQYVDAESRGNYGTEDTPLAHTLESGETASETYELHGDDIRGAGTRYVRGEFEPPILEYSTEESEAWQSFLPEVAVSLEKTDLL
jgi:hypothetical protein